MSEENYNDLLHGFAQCHDCKWVWRAICYKDTADQLECPHCGETNGAIFEIPELS